MNKVIVFTEKADTFTMDLQLKAIREYYDIDEIKRISAFPDISLLKEEIENSKEFRNVFILVDKNSIDLTENYIKSKYKRYFENIMCIPEQFKRFNEVEVQQNKQQTNQSNQSQSPIDIYMYTYNCPIKGAGDFAKKLLSIRNANKNVYIAIPPANEKFGQFVNDTGCVSIVSSLILENDSFSNNTIPLSLDINKLQNDIISLKLQNNNINIHCPEEIYKTYGQEKVGNINIVLDKNIPNTPINENKQIYSMLLEIQKDFQDKKIDIDKNKISKPADYKDRVILALYNEVKVYQSNPSEVFKGTSITEYTTKVNKNSELFREFLKKYFADDIEAWNQLLKDGGLDLFTDIIKYGYEAFKNNKKVNTKTVQKDEKGNTITTSKNNDDEKIIQRLKNSESIIRCHPKYNSLRGMF